ncbi:MAG: carboxymuconolactone decarboxylase family protein [Spirochaetales bacterium]|uniref:Carboxymuconolactone decarboxylase family protein n=1 Tax=Candidatus Thalassospirochaeta sargassi TaxID=3119039 RepID=A0AAJ1MNH3_9SPIO|nr:carboxymuconolactone decarboxylase family protein [Spirochaetales bacterium]
MAEKRLRNFETAGEFFRMFGGVFRTMSGMRRIPKNERIAAEFSERIMLAVTAVNQCAYCSFLHTQTALEKGVQLDQIHQILEGEIGSFSDEEIPAVLYGQHYAETKGNVSAAAREKFISAYGASRAGHIEGYIMSVCFGNLCSNTVYTRENNLLTPEQKRRGLLLYLLCKPIAAGIRRSGKR